MNGVKEIIPGPNGYYRESELQWLDKMLSKIAIFVIKIYSNEDKRTAHVIKAYLISLTFLQSPKSKPNGNSDNKTTGTLAVTSFVLPKILNDKHSIQK